MQNRNQTGTCPDSKGTFLIFSESARGLNTRPHKQCITYYMIKETSTGHLSGTGRIPHSAPP